METFIGFIIVILIFAVVAWGLYYIVKKFELPQPVLWICGALLLIVILLYLARVMGSTGGGIRIPGLGS